MFFLREQFLYDHSHFFDPISKMLCNGSLKLNMARRRHDFFSALCPESEEQSKLA